MEAYFPMQKFHLEFGTVSYYSTLHSQSLIAALDASRTDGYMTDLTIDVNGKQFCCHKLVLASTSSYFKNMFSGNFLESHSKVVKFSEITSEAFEAILVFFYTGKVKIVERIVYDLTYAAHMFLLNEVISACRMYLIEHLKPTNAITSYLVGQMYGFHDIIQLSLNCMVEHFSEVAKSSEFANLKYEDLTQIICDPKLSVSKDDVLVAIVNWIQSNNEVDESDIIALITAVPIESVKPEFIKQILSSEMWKKLPICTRYLERMAGIINKKDLLILNKPFNCEIYIFGGVCYYLKALIRFNVETGKYMNLAPMPNNHVVFGCPVVNNKLYAIGGDDVGFVDEYDPITNAWHSYQFASLQGSSPSVAELGGFIYACGGRKAALPWNVVSKYDPGNNEWSSVANMQMKRFGAAAVSVNGYLYVIGGWNGQEALSSCERYCPETDEWKAIARLPRPRYVSGSAVLKNCLYILGGSDGESDHPNVFCYNSTTDMWSEFNEMPFSASYVSACASGNKIIITGGQVKQRSLSFISKSAVFDVEFNIWSDGPNLPYHLCGHGSCCLASS